MLYKVNIACISYTINIWTAFKMERPKWRKISPPLCYGFEDGRVKCFPSYNQRGDKKCEWMDNGALWSSDELNCGQHCHFHTLHIWYHCLRDCWDIYQQLNHIESVPQDQCYCFIIVFCNILNGMPVCHSTHICLDKIPILFLENVFIWLGTGIVYTIPFLGANCNISLVIHPPHWAGCIMFSGCPCVHACVHTIILCPKYLPSPWWELVQIWLQYQL